MMTEIHYVLGDATAPAGAGHKLIVHGCNDLGRWGKGFVLAISKRWPEPERRYRAWHRGEDKESGAFALGAVQFVTVRPDLTIGNLISQHGIGKRKGVAPVRYDALRTGFRQVAVFALEKSASVHMPRIGCGLAGGNWDEVEVIIEEELPKRGIPVTIYDLPPKTGVAT